MSQIQSNNTKANTHEFDLQDGISTLCVMTPDEELGTWILKPVGCHGYAKPSIEWTGGHVELIPVTHAYVGRIVTTENVSDLIVNVIPTDEKAILANR